MKGAAPKATRILLFYVSNPVKAIDGYADFIERRMGATEDVWKENGDESVLQSKQSFLEFIGDPERARFFRQVHQSEKSFQSHIAQQLAMFLGVKRLSRKGFYLNKNMTDKLISMME